jgi:hypothetical protein
MFMILTSFPTLVSMVKILFYCLLVPYDMFLACKKKYIVFCLSFTCMCYDAHAGMCGASRVTGWAVAHPGIWGKADLYTVAVLYNATVCVCADISSLVPHAGSATACRHTKSAIYGLLPCIGESCLHSLLS